jgi:hypothetical protein
MTETKKPFSLHLKQTVKSVPEVEPKVEPKVELKVEREVQPPIPYHGCMFKLCEKTALNNNKRMVGFSEQKHEQWLKWIESVKERDGVPLDPTGVSFFDQKIYKHTERDFKENGIGKRYIIRNRKAHPGQLFSLPSTAAQQPGTSSSSMSHFIYYIERDTKIQFSTDANTLLVITDGQRSTPIICGVIDVATNSFHSRFPDCGVNENRALIEHLPDVMKAIGTDAQGYFSENGRKIGKCMVCHKPLTDTVSIAHGYGSVCGSNMNWR